MPEVTIEHTPTLDLLDTGAPSLSTTTDVPKVETKPDSQPAPKEEVKPEAKVEAAPDEGKKPEESATPEEPADLAASDEPKKAKGVQKRIDELVKQREDAERRAEAEKAEKLRLLALVEKGSKPEQPKVETDPEPQKPSREAFNTTDEYVAALADYADAKASWSSKQAVNAALAEEAKKAEQRHIEQSRKAAQDAYNARVEKVTAKYADYKQVAESPDVTVSMPMAVAILHSEHGPEIQYFLGKNPAEATRISNLNPAEQLVELGIIVARLGTPEKPEPKVEHKPPVSSAPKPIKPLEKPSSSAVAKSPDEETMEEYAARRDKELAAERRSGARH